jgi:hypothetical protein
MALAAAINLTNQGSFEGIKVENGKYKATRRKMGSASKTEENQRQGKAVTK